MLEPILKKLSPIASGLLPSGALVMHPMMIENIDFVIHNINRSDITTLLPSGEICD
jgi:hypothetical protein